ncbi:glycosyltransferase [Bifidobacterium felsineum]|uniref:glycosyltransferase n=1 Tax=Bifidobacterium felsineum TaxID=2045440 RepID=UPI001F0AC9F9|nr:glycosyltransferase [Bifidobacterium felsineum]
MQLVVIGSGSKEYKKYCQTLLTSNSNRGYIHIDNIDNEQLQFIYSKADIFLSTSTQEIFGMVILEAMFYGLPVVSSLTAGSDTLIQNGFNGFIIDKYNEEHWCKIIQKILDNPTEKKIIGNRASLTIKSSFTWKSIAKQIINTISNEGIECTK